ncbi:MAG: protein-tyrosine phosphatase family protein, partial [Ignavibacteria bacterium]|nr:protein-tyrosine phosphatase family protein [Ignavibacteria bacterium]
RSEFGEENVCSTAIPNGYLCNGETLHGKILSFLRESDQRGEQLVVHCSGGRGQAGHILSAWLVHARAITIDEALSIFRQPRKNPREAVILGHALMEELRGLLANCEPRSAA